MDRFDLRNWPGFVEAGGNPSRPAIVDQIVIDSRRISSHSALFVPLRGEHLDGHQFIGHAAQSGARYILTNKDWQPQSLPEDVQLLRVENTLKAFQEIAHAYRMQLPGKIIAIAGSFGKTMVKDLLHAFLNSTYKVAASPESFNSQIGVALSLLTVTKSHQFALIEAGISQREEMDRLRTLIAPNHVVLTHVGKKHLATLGNMETIAAEMMKIAFSVPEKEWALFPENPLIQTHLQGFQGDSHFWNQNSQHLPHAVAMPSEQEDQLNYHINFPDGTTYAGKTSFGFYYFLDLINITIKAAWLVGVSSEAIRNTLSSYVAEPMRTEIWRSPTGITFINDTYCSDPQSVHRSLRYFEQSQTGRKVFVFGGMRGRLQDSNADYRHVGQMVQRAKVDLLLLVGEHPYDPLISEIQKHPKRPQIISCKDHQVAIDKMRNWGICLEDVVLIKGEKKVPLDTFTEAFNDSICTNQCLINLAAIESNIATVRRKLAPNTRIMVMVKALAYGTNDIRMARFLSSCGIDVLGVSYVDEGVALKRAGVTQAIFVINAAVYEAAKVVKWGLEVGVSEKNLIATLANEASKQNKRIKVHLHVDTGMSRFGCRPEESQELANFILSFPMLELEGIMTHFACADDPTQDTFTIMQAQSFENVIQELKKAGISIPWCHAANSSGVMRFDFPQFNMVRIGLAVYGLYPSEATKNTLNLRLALSLISRLVGINTCRSGETISYGRSYTVRRNEQRIGVLPIGYFDGLHRNYSGRGSVVIRGKKAPMVGKICMDFMMVDITDISNASIGDSVLIFGEDEHGQYLSPEELAQSGDSIIYELITCLGPRIQRIFIHEEAHQKR